MYDIGEKTYIDAARHLAESLVELQNVHDSGLCTVCNKELIHSYRANRKDEQGYRNAAIICLR